MKCRKLLMRMVEEIDMANYSNKRGVNYNSKKKMSLEEKRRQWNIDLASRTLDNMFGQVDVGDDVIIHNLMM